MVFTGVSSAADLLAAPPALRPTFLAFDLRGLVDEDRTARIPVGVADGARSVEWSVDNETSRLVLASSQQGADVPQAVSDAGALRALAMLAATAWASGVTAVHAQDQAAAAALWRCKLAGTT
jgi:hypothetical protein